MLGAVTLSPSTLEPIINEMAAKYNIEPALVKAIIKTESNWDVNASRFEAHKGDASWGLMQLLLATARTVLNNQALTTTQLIQPRVNIEAGTKLMLENWNRWGNLRDAVAAYNAGSPRLGKDGKYINKDYVNKVFRNYDIYKKLGTSIVAEAAIDTVEVLSSPESIPMYMLLGLGIAGLVVISNAKSEG